MNKLNLKFMSKTENILICRALVSSFMLTLDCDLEDLNEVKTIVSEAVTNAIIHGYKSVIDKEVELNIYYDNFIIEMEVIDKGVGIPNIEEAKQPMYSTKNEDRSGVGFTIMEVFSDSLEVFSEPGEGTKIKCRKKLIFDELSEAS